MNVLVAIHHRVTAWAIPHSHIDILRARFPHVTFLHAVDRESDLALAADADVAFTLCVCGGSTARVTPSAISRSLTSPYAASSSPTLAACRPCRSPNT
jgi:hypothetical protein